MVDLGALVGNEEALWTRRNARSQHWKERSIGECSGPDVSRIRTEDLKSPFALLAFGTTQFTIGTEQGRIVSCNRQGKNDPEKVGNVFPGHWSLVYALQRDPNFTKNSLSIGDWTVPNWSEEMRDDCIMWTKSNQSNQSWTSPYWVFLDQVCMPWPMLNGPSFARRSSSPRRWMVK